ncbi:acyl carrier protein [Sphingomonas arenae]|uniref:acyl carrier protein n=1 Tax=Sphingomonas arenae TaxID=2812555 RepID=UPI001967699E|nr:acyl carrier protein [Sphingomonas arenae]
MTSEAAVLARLQPLFDTIFGEDSVPLTMTTTSDDIATWDSVAHVSVIVGVEQEFGIMFDPEEMMEMESVGALVGSVQAKMADAA